MAKKGKRKAKKAPKERRRKPQAQSQASIPDRRVMEGIMRQFAGGTGDRGAPLEVAQEIMYQAFETQSPRRQVALAPKAIQTCPDCADAYVLLAEHAETREEALDLYEQGVAAGERALGEKGFREYEGHFWGFLETRPYMRARKGMADCLWAAGRREEAVGHYREMLRLNPNDNQGIRYLLASALLDLERHAELEQLLESYAEDSSAEWAYARALLAFREEGDSERARQALRAAKKTNKHVPDYLTGDKRFPRELPEYVTPGGADEGVGYAAQFLPAWKNTPGAVSWVRKTLKAAAPRPPAARKPLRQQAKRPLAALPQRVGEVWQADARPLQAWIRIEGEPARPWTTLVANASDDLILATDLSETAPEGEAFWKSVEKAMLEPAAGRPHRPGVVQGKLRIVVGSPWRLVRDVWHLQLPPDRRKRQLHAITHFALRWAVARRLPERRPVRG